jgi:hypothetical protein
MFWLTALGSIAGQYFMSDKDGSSDLRLSSQFQLAGTVYVIDAALCKRNWAAKFGTYYAMYSRVYSCS